MASRRPGGGPPACSGSSARHSTSGELAKCRRCARREVVRGAGWCAFDHPLLPKGAKCGHPTSNKGKPCSEAAIEIDGVRHCSYHLTDDELAAVSTFLSSTPGVAGRPPTMPPPSGFGAMDDLPVPTLRRIAPRYVDAVVRLILDHGEPLLQPSATRDEKMAAIHALLDVPKKFLYDVKGSRRRLERQLRCPLAPARAKSAPSRNEDERRLIRVRGLIADGYVGRGARLLGQTDVRLQLTDEELLDQMKQLHPDEPPPGALSTHPTVFDVDAEVLMRAIKSVCNGSAPGRSGWHADLIRLLLERPETRELIVQLFAHILNGDLSPDLKQRITACNLSAVPKTETKARPIAVSEVWYKIAGKYLLLTDQETLSDFFEPIQRGVACPRGNETIVHEVREALQPNSIVVTIDMSNAFNTVRRSSMRAALHSDVRWSRYHNLFNLGYAQHTDLYFHTGDDTHRIASACGARQGDPLGSFLFCLTIQPILVQAARDFPSIAIKAYMDDITLVSRDGDAKLIWRCFKHLERELAKVGLTCNRSKCEWFSCAARSPPEEAAAALTFRNRSERATLRLLGAYFGADEDVRERLRQEVLIPAQQMAEKLHALGGQEALIIACNSLKCVVGYFLRVHPPEQTRDLAAGIQRLLHTVVEHLAEIKLSHETELLLALPTRKGGLGIGDAARIAPCAYEASKSQALSPGETTLTQHQRVETLEDADVDFLAKLSEAWQRHLEENQAAGTGDFTRFVPQHSMPLDALTTGAALRLRLNAPHRALVGAPIVCPGCHKTLADERAVPHLAGCTLITGANSSSSHAELKRSVKELAGVGGLRYESNEPREYQTRVCPACHEHLAETDVQSHPAACPKNVTADALQHAHLSGPDVRFHPKDRSPVVVDVTLCSHTGSDSKDLAETLRHREQAKHRKYNEVVRANGEEFITVALTRNGAANGGTTQLAALIADERAQLSLTTHDVVREIRTAAIRAGAHSLINAEKRLGVHHVHRSRPNAKGHTQQSDEGDAECDANTRALLGPRPKTDVPAIRLPAAVESPAPIATAPPASSPIALPPPAALPQAPPAPAEPHDPATPVAVRAARARVPQLSAVSTAMPQPRQSRQPVSVRGAAALVLNESLLRGLFLVAIAIYLLCATPFSPATAAVAAVPLVLQHPYNPQRKCGVLVGLAVTSVLNLLRFARLIGLEFIVALLVFVAIRIRRSRLQSTVQPRSWTRHPPNTPASIWTSAQQTLRLDLSDTWHRRPDAPTASDLIHDYLLPPLAGAAGPLHIVPAYAQLRNSAIWLLYSSQSAEFAPLVESIGIVGNALGSFVAWFVLSAYRLALAVILHDLGLTAFAFTVTLLFLLIFKPDCLSYVGALAWRLVQCAMYFITVLCVVLLASGRGLLDFITDSPLLNRTASVAILTSAGVREPFAVFVLRLLTDAAQRLARGESYFGVGVNLAGEVVGHAAGVPLTLT